MPCAEILLSYYRKLLSEIGIRGIHQDLKKTNEYSLWKCRQIEIPSSTGSLVHLSSMSGVLLCAQPAASFKTGGLRCYGCRILVPKLFTRIY
jgi:hypothetical protein